MDSAKYIGLDVHKESISIAVMNTAAKIVMECAIETKAITPFDIAIVGAAVRLETVAREVKLEMANTLLTCRRCDIAPAGFSFWRGM